jgi:hypothetical protein
MRGLRMIPVPQFLVSTFIDSPLQAERVEEDVRKGKSSPVAECSPLLVRRSLTTFSYKLQSQPMATIYQWVSRMDRINPPLSCVTFITVLLLLGDIPTGPQAST